MSTTEPSQAGQAPGEDLVKSLVQDYIRGERTPGEVRDEIRVFPEAAPLLAQCLGVNTLPHELLEAVGLSPFDTGIEFESKLVITRDGLARNLRLAREGTLDAGEFCDWATDWFSWQICDPPDDDVVVELAGELILGPERVEEIVASEDLFGVFEWHLENTPAAMREQCALGLAIMNDGDALALQIRQRLVDDMTQDALDATIAKTIADYREGFPSFEDDFREAVQILAQGSASAERVHAFVRCLARRADPLWCAESPED